MSSPSKAEWESLLAPLLSDSIDEANEKITSHSSIQSWLQSASFEVAGELTHPGSTQARSKAHRRMISSLKSSFPELQEAVRELTEGCGTLGLKWRPLSPNHSVVQIDFARDFEVDLFIRLDDPSESDLRDALSTIEDALPGSSPFPNRPNVATGLVGHNGRCLGVRVLDHLNPEGHRWKDVTVLRKQKNPIEELERTEAIRHLADWIAESASRSG